MDDTAPTDPLAQVAALVQQGFVARLWIFPLAADGSLRRDVQQIDGVPVSPDAAAVRAIRSLLEFVLDGDTEVVVVIERPAAPRPTPDDWAWHDVFCRAVRGTAVTVRGVLLAHRDGIDVLEPRTLTA